MKQKIKIIQTIIFIFFMSLPFYANAMTVEEIIKGRKAMFSENYQNAKKISILLKSKKIEEAKPLMKKICLLYTSPSPRDKRQSRMPSSA